jgi:hypothetical protein
MTCSLLAGLLVWIAVPACWLVWRRYVHSVITRDVAFGRSAFILPLMKWTVYGLILGAVAAVLVWFKKPCHAEDLMLARTLLIFIVSVVVIFFVTVARGTAHAGAVTGRVLLQIFQEAITRAFIPAALYVVVRLVRL